MLIHKCITILCVFANYGMLMNKKVIIWFNLISYYLASALNSVVGSFLIDNTPEETTTTTKLFTTTTIYPSLANNTIQNDDEQPRNRYADVTRLDALNLTNAKVLSARESTRLILSEIATNYLDSTQQDLPLFPPLVQPPPLPSLQQSLQSLKGRVIPALYMPTTTLQPSFVQYGLNDDVPLGGWRRRLKNDVVVAKKLNATQDQFVSGPNNDTNTHPEGVRDKRKLALSWTQVGYSNAEVSALGFCWRGEECLGG
jgi:hypothetical protein